MGFLVTNSAQTRKNLLSGSMPMHSTTFNDKAELIKLLSKARNKLDESLLLIASILGEDCEDCKRRRKEQEGRGRKIKEGSSLQLVNL